MTKDTKPEPTSKQFGLKPIEKQMLQVLQDQYYTTLSNFLSFIALERLAYQVTQNTKFEINGDMLTITEAAPETAPETPNVDLGSTDTKDALKG